MLGNCDWKILRELRKLRAITLEDIKKQENKS